MSRKLDSPVQTQMAVAVFKSPLGGEYHGSKRMEGKQPAGRRRVFVQTDTGCVLGMELDRSDNAHTVKRRLQIALNVSTEESSLTFGDMVLKNDLSAVRNDSPLLLTRNYLHRSSSTPCLSPTGRDVQQRDQSRPIEILGQSNSFAKMKPPTDEEPFAPNNPKGFVGKALGQPGLKRSVRVGETGFREVAAYLLDHDHFANVPPTALVKEAAIHGLCLAEIGEMMSREFRPAKEEPSELELVCIEARRLIAEREAFSPRGDLGDDQEFQFDLDCDETPYDFTAKLTADDYMIRSPFQFGIGSGSGRFPLSKLEESIEEDEESEGEEEQEGFAALRTLEKLPTISKLSMSLKSTTLGDKNQKLSGTKPENGCLSNRSSGHRSANEQLPASVSFVELADMTEEEWTLFLEKFQELLYPAFAKRKSVALGQRQRQRLGTSCQF
ncbi:phosphatidylinositol 4-kinase gamma 5 [Populus alba x Populus x berolinensis]|nr:phosphatidylinositol 4-kinase gamma 5 [Populus alba x Populus x berolinensis]